MHKNIFFAVIFLPLEFIIQTTVELVKMFVLTAYPPFWRKWFYKKSTFCQEQFSQPLRSFSAAETKRWKNTESLFNTFGVGKHFSEAVAGTAKKKPKKIQKTKTVFRRASGFNEGSKIQSFLQFGLLRTRQRHIFIQSRIMQYPTLNQ